MHIGQIGKFMRLARAAGCRDVVFIGSLVRPSLWQVHPDLKGLSVLPRVIAAYRGGDNHLLTGMGKVLEHDGFRLLGAHEVAPEILMPEGVWAAHLRRSATMPTLHLALIICTRPGNSISDKRWSWPAFTCLPSKPRREPTRCSRAVAEMRTNGRVRAPRGTGTW